MIDSSLILLYRPLQCQWYRWAEGPFWGICTAVHFVEAFLDQGLCCITSLLVKVQ